MRLCLKTPHPWVPCSVPREFPVAPWVALALTSETVAAATTSPCVSPPCLLCCPVRCVYPFLCFSETNAQAISGSLKLEKVLLWSSDLAEQSDQVSGGEVYNLLSG